MIGIYMKSYLYVFYVIFKNVYLFVVVLGRLKFLRRWYFSDLFVFFLINILIYFIFIMKEILKEL